MKTGQKKMRLGKKGFTLLEVMIALSLFSIFFVVFLSSQSSNILSSTQMEQRLIMHNIAENIINDLLIAPPALKPQLTLRPQTYKYEDDDRFEYSVEFKQFELPENINLAQAGSEEGEEESEGAANPQSQYVKLLYKQVRTNIKESLWQVRIAVINKETEYEYWLTSWLRNPDYEISTQIPKVR